MTGKDYEADLGNGEPCRDQKLEGINFFNTIKQRKSEYVVVFINIVWGCVWKQAKWQYWHKNA